MVTSIMVGASIMPTGKGPKMTDARQFIPALIAAGMLFGALGRWPYSYYIVLRWVTCAAAVVVVYHGHVYRKPWAIWVFIFIAALFNPILPVHLTREAWRIIDLAAATTFVAAAFTITKPTPATPADQGTDE